MRVSIFQMRIRIYGIIGGILALLLAFAAEIPLSLDNSFIIDFYFFRAFRIRFYCWGYISNGIGYTHITVGFPTNLYAIAIWLFVFLTGIILIMASLPDSDPSNSFKLYILSMIMSALVLIFYGYLIFRAFVQDRGASLATIGVGYYLLIIILGLNILTFLHLKKEYIL
ncbi:MAG: hypothetical protein GF383_12970 [Candidatus Lokiarchaeota archaeon]|nr:hypothetical protein [Candidatus Lokiarchaeota archaeon]MBD3342019.1 hypothetical protein [Candidatus Lokiarchaeota archaeon]